MPVTVARQAQYIIILKIYLIRKSIPIVDLRRSPRLSTYFFHKFLKLNPAEYSQSLSPTHSLLLNFIFLLAYSACSLMVLCDLNLHSSYVASTSRNIYVLPKPQPELLYITFLVQKVNVRLIKHISFSTYLKALSCNLSSSSTLHFWRPSIIRSA